MTAKTQYNKRIEDMLTRTQTAMSRTSWFEAERLAVKALEAAREGCDFELMSRICPSLQEARRQRMLQAIEAASNKVEVLEGIDAEPKITAGVVLVQPPAVGADGRRLRVAALNEEVPLLVATREPSTRLGQCPIVTIGRITVRAYVDQPKKESAPTVKWVLNAIEQLGNAALESVDDQAEPLNRIDALLARLDSVPDHERLHEELTATCKLINS